jgi:hypothetical protein
MKCEGDKSMVIDFHYHYANIPNYIEDLLNSMDRAGVDKTVLLAGSHDSYADYFWMRWPSLEPV